MSTGKFNEEELLDLQRVSRFQYSAQINLRGCYPDEDITLVQLNAAATSRECRDLYEILYPSRIDIQ